MRILRNSSLPRRQSFSSITCRLVGSTALNNHSNERTGRVIFPEVFVLEKCIGDLASIEKDHFRERRLSLLIVFDKVKAKD